MIDKEIDILLKDIRTLIETSCREIRLSERDTILLRSQWGHIPEKIETTKIVQFKH